METKFLSEIVKNKNIEKFKEFEKEVRKKIIEEFEILRSKDDEISRDLMSDECWMWEEIKNRNYWFEIKIDKKKLFKLIDIYLNFTKIIYDVNLLKKEVEQIKEMETKFFSEIVKNKDIEKLKEIQKEVRTKIIDEFEIIRSKDDEISHHFRSRESRNWREIIDKSYFCLKIESDEKKKLFNLIVIYSKFGNIFHSFNSINEKVEKIKEIQKED